MPPNATLHDSGKLGLLRLPPALPLLSAACCSRMMMAPSNSVRSDQALLARSLCGAVVHRRAPRRKEGREPEKNPKSRDVLARTNTNNARGRSSCRLLLLLCYDVLVPVSRSGERARQASINSPCLCSSWGIEHPMQEPRFAFHWIGGRMRQSLELGFPGPGGERARKNCQLDNGSRL